MNTRARQRVTLNNLSEPQQLRELNRQLEWVWSQLMGGLTSRSFSEALREDIARQAADDAAERLLTGFAEKYTGNARVTIGAGGDFATLGAFAETVDNRLLTSDVTAEIVSDLSGSVRLSGMTGAGRLEIEGGGHTLTGGLSLNGARVGISALSFAAPVTVSGGDVRFSGVEFDGNGEEAALDAGDGAHCRLENCGLANAVSLIRLRGGASLDGHGLRGGGSRWLDAEHAAIRMSGTRPAGGVQLAACLCAPADLSALTVDSGVS